MLRRIVAALAAVVVLGAGLWWASLRQTRADREERQAARLPAFDERAVSAVTLTTRAGTWRLARGAEGWRLAVPVEDRANAPAIERLLGAVRRVPVARTIDPAESLSTYGLDPPVARLAIEGPSVPALDLGDVAPTGDGVFARLDGRREILLLKLPEGAPLVAPDGNALREAALCDLAPSAVDGIVLAPSGVRLSRGADGWWIDAPRRLPADESDVASLVAAVAGAKVVAFDDTAKALDPRFGLGASAWRATLHAPSGFRDLAIGGAAGDGRRYAVAGGRPGVLVVEGAALQELPQSLAALCAPKVTNVNRYHVAEIDYAAGDARFAARRKDDAEWATASGASVPAAEVYALLVSLLEAPAKACEAGELSGPPDATLDYATDGGARGRVAFQGGRAAWSAAPGTVYRVSGPPPVPPAR